MAAFTLKQRAQPRDELSNEELLPYLKDRVPIDSETGQRVTGNPLMLSMVVSIYEVRAGVHRSDRTRR